MPVPLHYLIYKICHPVMNEVELREVSFDSAGEKTLLTAPAGHSLAVKVFRIYNSSDSEVTVEVRDSYIVNNTPVTDTVLRLSVGPKETVILTRDDLPRLFTSIIVYSSGGGVYIQGTLEVY